MLLLKQAIMHIKMVCGKMFEAFVDYISKEKLRKRDLWIFFNKLFSCFDDKINILANGFDALALEPQIQFVEYKTTFSFNVRSSQNTFFVKLENC